MVISSKFKLANLNEDSVRIEMNQIKHYLGGEGRSRTYEVLDMIPVEEE